MEQIFTWDKQTTVLSSEDLERPYNENSSKSGRSYKIGQMKLLVNEVLFLINHWNTTDSRDGIHIVVAGAVTGEHFACIIDMFPQIKKIDLWDPKPELSIKNDLNPKIEFHQDFLTIEEASRYKGMNVFFISDLRTATLGDSMIKYRKENNISSLIRLNKMQMERSMRDTDLSDSQRNEISSELLDGKDTIVIELTGAQINTIGGVFVERLSTEHKIRAGVFYDEDIWVNDHGLQKDLVLAMEPRHALLKFRVPFDYYQDETKTVNYFDGYIYKQVFSSTVSTEMRLVPSLWDNTGKFNPKYINYSVQQIERKLAYYNKELRDDVPGLVKIWRNSVNNSTEVLDNNRLVNSYDTCYLFYVLDRYLWFMGDTTSNPDERMISVMALWNWIIETLEKYKKGGRYDFADIRRKTAKAAYVSTETQQSRPSVKYAAPTFEQLVCEIEIEPVIAQSSIRLETIMSFDEMSFFEQSDLDKEIESLM